jgi:hypothetical protein
MVDRRTSSPVSIALLLIALIAIAGGLGPPHAAAGADAVVEGDDDEGGGTPDPLPIADQDESATVVGVCSENPDPFNSDAIWTICRQSESDVWISSVGPDGGEYHAEQICADLGYPTLAEFGGNCGNECGRCEGETSCESPGSEFYDGAGTSCGSDENGPVLCFTVTWRCTRDL